MCNVHITFYETEQVVGAESAFVAHNCTFVSDLGS